jgi:uncharacterized protein YuzE
MSHSVYCYLRTGEIRIARTLSVPASADVNVDYDSTGEPVGVEILDVQRVTIDGIDVHL